MRDAAPARANHPGRDHGEISYESDAQCRRSRGASHIGEQFLGLIKKEIQIYRKVATDLGLKAE